MTQSNSSQESGNNTYIFDAESASEMARLLDQDKLTTEGMGGIFPERENDDLVGVSRILDIACGPGGWVHEVAHTYPNIEVVGIDISKNMVNYARAHAQVRHLDNANFQVMDALKPLDFPDAAFDLVNMRAVAGFVPPQAWPQFLAESKRVLRAGGTLRLTDGDIGFTNAPALEALIGTLYKAMHLARRSFAPTGRHMGLTPMLKSLLRKAGFENIHHLAHGVDYSFGAKHHESTYQDLQLMFKLAQPFLVQVKATTPEEFERLQEQAIAEMQSEDFCGLGFLLTVWGEKP